LRRDAGIAKIELARILGSQASAAKAKDIWEKLDKSQDLRPEDRHFLEESYALERDSTPNGRSIPKSKMGVKAPNWIWEPNYTEIMMVNPRVAVINHISGTVEVRCRIRLDKTLTDCVTVEENPAGYGFANGILQLTKVVLMSPMAIDGKPNEYGIVYIPFQFNNK
jgi:hypothetical protein